jgi:hypothetical protein
MAGQRRRGLVIGALAAMLGFCVGVRRRVTRRNPSTPSPSASKTSLKGPALRDSDQQTSVTVGIAEYAADARDDQSSFASDAGFDASHVETPGNQVDASAVTPLNSLAKPRYRGVLLLLLVVLAFDALGHLRNPNRPDAGELKVANHTDQPLEISMVFRSSDSLSSICNKTGGELTDEERASCQSHLQVRFAARVRNGCGDTARMSLPFQPLPIDDPSQQPEFEIQWDRHLGGDPAELPSLGHDDWYDFAGIAPLAQYKPVHPISGADGHRVFALPAVSLAKPTAGKLNLDNCPVLLNFAIDGAPSGFDRADPPGATVTGGFISWQGVELPGALNETPLRPFTAHFVNASAVSSSSRALYAEGLALAVLTNLLAPAWLKSLERLQVRADADVHLASIFLAVVLSAYVAWTSGGQAAWVGLLVMLATLGLLAERSQRTWMMHLAPSQILPVLGAASLAGAALLHRRPIVGALVDSDFNVEEIQALITVMAVLLALLCAWLCSRIGRVAAVIVSSALAFLLCRASAGAALREVGLGYLGLFPVPFLAASALVTCVEVSLAAASTRRLWVILLSAPVLGIVNEELLARSPSMMLPAFRLLFPALQS